MIWPPEHTNVKFRPDTWIAECYTHPEARVGCPRKFSVWLLGYHTLNSKIIEHQTTHDFIAHGRVHRPTKYSYSALSSPMAVSQKNTDMQKCIFVALRSPSPARARGKPVSDRA